jgi:hypothetical protein
LKFAVSVMAWFMVIVAEMLVPEYPPDDPVQLMNVLQVPPALADIVTGVPALYHPLPGDAVSPITAPLDSIVRKN